MPSPARALFVLLLSAALVGPAAAQDPPSPPPEPAGPADAREAVRAAVIDLFDAMREGNGDGVRAAFASNGRLQTTRVKGDSTVLQTTPVEAFAAAVDGDRDAPWDERIWDEVIQVDGPLATAWTPYAFYLGDELSHCGVNAFQLIRRNGAWKILQITDTRHAKESCDIPEEVRKGR